MRARDKEATAAPDGDSQPTVSVIIPSRNEEANLVACLESLIMQSGVTFEIIVIDDDSSDATAEIARGFPGVEVVPAGPLPKGWGGKSTALNTGAQLAPGRWLLFTAPAP